MKYRRKSSDIVDAVQFLRDNVIDVMEFLQGMPITLLSMDDGDVQLDVDGCFSCELDDWIVRAPDGSLHKMSAREFRQEFEEALESGTTEVSVE